MSVGVPFFFARGTNFVWETGISNSIGYLCVYPYFVLPSSSSIRLDQWLQTPRRVRSMLLLALVFLGGSTTAFFVLQSQRLIKSSFEQSILDRVRDEIRTKHRTNEKLKASIRQSGFFNFQQLLDKGELQYVYNNGNLIFWGDNHFFPEYKKVAGDYSEKYIELMSGKFLAVRDTLAIKGEVFDVVSLLPLFYSYDISNQYIQSSANAKLFEKKPVEINNYGIEGDVWIKNLKGDYLFSVQVPRDFKQGVGWINFLLIVSIVFFLLVLTAYVWTGAKLAYERIFKWYQRTGGQRFAFNYEADFVLVVLFGYTLLVRLSLLLLGIPNSIFNIRFFNPHYYNWDMFTPSPGDLLLHLLFAVAYLLAVKHLFRKTGCYHFFERPSMDRRWLQHGIKVILVLLSHLALYLMGVCTSLIFTKLKYPLDVSELLSPDVSSLLTAIVYVLAGGLFFGLLRASYELVSKSIQQGLLFEYLPGALLFLLIAGGGHLEFATAVASAHSLCFAVAFLLKLPSSKHSFDYAALVFFTLGALSSAIVVSLSIMYLYPKRDLELKTSFITQQLVENNLLGERLLNQISGQVASDPYVANAFSNPMFSVKDMEEKVRRFYLGNYLNRYDIQVMAFDDKGISLNVDDKRTFWDVRNRFAYKLYRTTYPEVFYYITQQNQLLKNYLSLVSVFRSGIKIGTILIDLQPKKMIPNSILPVLLVDKKSEVHQNAGNYSYAVFNNGAMTNSFGIFNFKNELTSKLLLDSAKYNTNQLEGGNYFLVSDLGKGRKIIVQSSTQTLWVFISNMAFLFVILELALSFFFIANLVFFNFDRFYNSLTFKIQFYSVMAFFIPVGLVSGGVLTAVISSYNQELKTHFRENATTIAYALSEDLQKYYHQEMNFDKLNETVLRIARLYNTDVNIFRRNGMLLVSSSPIIFKAGLVSPLVDPNAYHAIRQEKNKLFLQEETIGKLAYNHVYIQVRSSESGEELGIISIPFFASGQELSNRITNTLKIIVNIATFTFMVFLFFSFTASNFITYPLKLITHRIRKTTLESSNRPLNWQSKDELGLLIREYNLMLQKLEQNKRSLAISQKESAWREVAQQVAHEIKNPLTPIKLSLQHMRRVLSKEVLKEPAKLDTTIQNLIAQVETLDGIASSFSIYAKMPAFSLELIDLKKVVRQVIDVYLPEKKEYVHCVFSENESCAVADERMLGRIVANLLLNAFQAVPTERIPAVSITVEERPEGWWLSILDNGTGIPEESRDKVFEPHFSTKFAGSGIGLYIAKKGIEQMGGSIAFDTTEGVGTSFHIQLRKA